MLKLDQKIDLLAKQILKKTRKWSRPTADKFKLHHKDIRFRPHSINSITLIDAT
jgi:hypothetical protein